MNDNLIIALNEPLQATLDKLLQTATSAVKLGGAMQSHCPQKYRHTLIAVRELINEELYHLDRKVA